MAEALVGSPHFDAGGRALMVDVAGKDETHRVATARGLVELGPEAFARVRDGTAAKGDVLAVARLAGIMAAKRTSEWIPLCHPLPLTSVTVRFHLCDPCVEAEVEAACVGRTGVEMEALVATSAALLTIVDMTKAYGRGPVISAIRLIAKSGGRSGHWGREGEALWPSSEVR